MKKEKSIHVAFIAEYKRKMKIFGVLAALATLAFFALAAFQISNDGRNFYLDPAVIRLRPLGYGVNRHGMTSKIDFKNVRGAKWGEFMAGLHAIHANDFDAMKEFSEVMPSLDPESDSAKEIYLRAAFISGADIDMENFDISADNDTPVSFYIKMISYVNSEKWKSAEALLEKHDLFLLAPAKILTAIYNGKPDKAQQIADSKNFSENMRSFYKGFAYAVSGYPKAAKKYFDRLDSNYLNLNDFIFIRAYYEHNKMDDALAELTTRFKDSPRGNFIADIDSLPDWSQFDTRPEQLRFGLISVIAHNPFMIGSAWGMVLLRTAEGIEAESESDALNYYLGLNFKDEKTSEHYLSKIPDTSAFYLFARINSSGQKTSEKELVALIKKFPSATPVIVKLALLKISENDLDGALRVADAALDRAFDATPKTTAYLLKLRAHVNYLAGDFDAAITDLDEASGLVPQDGGIVADKVRVNAKKGENLDAAYEMASALLRSDIGVSDYWDAMACVLTAQGEPGEAVKIYQRVLRMAPNNSAILENAGDAAAGVGEIKRAKQLYQRALELKGDGQINPRALRKKLNYLR